MNVLEIENLRKCFDENLVLDDLSLSVPDHTATVLIGASGSGKSTLLRCINLLDSIDDGAIYLDGREISDPGIDVDEVRRSLGMVFQSFNLFPHKTAIENVMAGPILAKGVSRDEARNLAERLLFKVGLSEKLEAYPTNLSGGQQQRVAIARALAMQPEVMLFDEVTSALDPELVGEVLRVIRDLANEGMTMVLVTHEMYFAREVGDKILFFDAGRIVEQGVPKQVLDDPQSDRLKMFLRRFSEKNFL